MNPGGVRDHCATVVVDAVLSVEAASRPHGTSPSSSSSTAMIIPPLYKPKHGRHVAKIVDRLRRSILRAVAIVSFFILGFDGSCVTVMTPAAHAARGDAVTVVSATTTGSLGRKLARVLVAAGAIAAGAAASKKARSSMINNDDGTEPTADALREDDIPKVVPKDRPSPLPLRTKSPKLSSKETDASTLVKDLDSKIEMLRAREEKAMSDAERRRREEVAEAEAEEEARIIAAEEEEGEMARREEAAMRLERERREGPLSSQPEGGKEQEQRTATANGVDGGTRQQPKSPEEERLLKERYGGMELEERAFNILVDLGMVDLHSDPPENATSED